MPHNDYVSVTIVTYNSGRFIKRCLESVLEQKYEPKEIIVIDNASTDGTVDILEQFEGSCRVVYNSENIGFAGAQNQAIELAKGTWILTLNPDVLMLPNFLQSLVVFCTSGQTGGFLIPLLMACYWRRAVISLCSTP